MSTDASSPSGKTERPCPLCHEIAEDIPSHIRKRCNVAREDRQHLGLPPEGHHGDAVAGSEDWALGKRVTDLDSEWQGEIVGVDTETTPSTVSVECDDGQRRKAPGNRIQIHLDR